MKILKRVVIGILFLIGLILVLGLFMPKEVNVVKSTTIDATQADVFKAINELKTWEEWSPWQEEDPTIKNVYSDKPSGVGAYYTWTSKNSGAGKMTITKISGMDTLATALDFDGEGQATSDFYLSPSEAGTETTWTFHTEMPYPFNAMLLFRDMEGVLGEYYENGLASLKKHVETNKTPEYSIDEIDFPATRYLAQKATIKMADMAQHFETVMPEVGAAFAQHNVEMAGPPAGLFYTWDEETQSSDLALGIQAAPDALIKGLTPIDLPAGKAYKIDYYGPYEGTGAAHVAMDDFLKRFLLEDKFSVAIERYITDPTTEPDSSKWLTEIVYPVSK